MVFCRILQYFVAKSICLRFTLFCRKICFVAIYAPSRGKKFCQKLYPWRKNDKYEVWKIHDIVRAGLYNENKYNYSQYMKNVIQLYGNSFGLRIQYMWIQSYSLGLNRQKINTMHIECEYNCTNRNSLGHKTQYMWIQLYKETQNTYVECGYN